MEIDFPTILEFVLKLWPALLVLHFVRAEDSRVRRVLLKIFARWLEVPLLWFIWVVCRGPLRFLTETAPIRKLLGLVATRPFAKYMDTGVPVPTKDVLRLVDLIDGPIAVGDCRCRLAKKTCDHPMRADIVFRTGAEAWLWAFPHNYVAIDKAEAKKIIEDCAGQGMFQMVFIHCSTDRHVNEYVVCNCCRCGCKVHLVNRTMGQADFPLRDGGYRSEHDPTKCKRCGTCVKQCPFDAISLTDDGIRIEDCSGCGMCERVCEQGAYRVTRKLPGPPWAQEAWQRIEGSAP